VVDGSPASAQHITVIADGQTLPVVTGLARPDVALHFGNPELKDCGYLARFEPLKTDSHIQLFVRDNSGKVVRSDKISLPASNLSPKRTAGKLVSSYQEWLFAYEPGLFWPATEVSHCISQMSYRPTISIILPVHDTDLFFISRAIQSVIGQHYPVWQLCVVDVSGGEQIKDFLKATITADPRVSLRVSDRNDGRAATSNAGLQMSSGDFIAVMGCNDELHPFAFVEIARALNEKQDTDLLYTDEDTLDLYGHRARPSFKPDFDLNMFRSFNYLGHLTAVRRSVALEAGGFRSAYDSAEDWDLAFRIIEATGPSRVSHVHKPLYHARSREALTSKGVSTAGWSSKAAVRVVSGHLERTNTPGIVEPGLYAASVRVKRTVPKDARIAVFLRLEDGHFQISALGPNVPWEQTQVYDVLGPAIYRTEAKDHKLPRPDPDVDFDVEFGCVRTLEELKEDVFVFINRPLETVNHLFFEELTAQALRSDCGLVTGISIDNRRTVHSGLIGGPAGDLVDPFATLSFNHHAYLPQLSAVRAVEAISDEFFAVRREHLASVGGLGAISANYMPRLAQLLADNAHDRDLQVVVTPYAVATFEGTSPRERSNIIAAKREIAIRCNANLNAFTNLAEVCQGHL
jgi:glycosyltransferase involved in cell wall biosynthesis